MNENSKPSNQTQKELKNVKKLTRERREEISRYIISISPYNLPIKQFSAKWGVSEVTIYKDIKIILSKFPKPLIDEIGKKLGLSYLAILNKAHTLMLHEDPKIAIDAAKLILEAGEKYTKMLEDFGLKDKVIPKIRIEQTTASVAQQMEEYKHMMEELESLPEDKQKLIRHLILGPGG